ncbi:hypothetical protein PVAP13_1NG189319 [Panicum virgatum]|uniref:Uncharacterized protein n=2 Tax=Panicum virgatum TaxID=38727 RepID=A0A8T0X3G3_PANVG|nr:hypothetical protein PVAP13_1NG189319 [Panicum virgatum]
MKKEKQNPDKIVFSEFFYPNYFLSYDSFFSRLYKGKQRRVRGQRTCITKLNWQGLLSIQTMSLSCLSLRNQNYMAMYSSIFGGITKDPSAMVIPIDDHMVHRGHGVFDTAAIMDGHLYELDQHLDRFLRSALMAKIPLLFDRSTIRSILIQTVSASNCTQGSLRYWLSVGPGDFQLSSSGCANPALYAVIESPSLQVPAGCKVVTSSIPIKSPQFAVMKSVNYLPNALTKVEGEENGAFTGIWLDDKGFVAEGSNMNVGFVTADKELLIPCFDKILSPHSKAGFDPG